jgi:hypothetical protein
MELGMFLECVKDGVPALVGFIHSRAFRYRRHGAPNRGYRHAERSRRAGRAERAGPSPCMRGRPGDENHVRIEPPGLAASQCASGNWRLNLYRSNARARAHGTRGSTRVPLAMLAKPAAPIRTPQPVAAARSAPCASRGRARPANRRASGTAATGRPVVGRKGWSRQRSLKRALEVCFDVPTPRRRGANIATSPLQSDRFNLY